jgi:hypothetical protein
MTYLEVVNRILRRLRETEVTSVNETAYSKLIGEFVNDIKEEIEGDHAWSQLWQTVHFDSQIAPVLTFYDLSATRADGGKVTNGFPVTTERSQLLYETRDYFTPVSTGRATLPSFYDVTDTNNAFRLGEVDYSNHLGAEILGSGDTSDQPSTFSRIFWPGAGGVGLLIQIDPIPTTVRTYSLGIYTPQAYLDSVTDDTTEVTVPSRPVILGAYMLALNERGEELGEPGGLIEQRYLEAKDSAIERDNEAPHRLNKLDVVAD